MKLDQIKKELKKYASREKADVLRRFFKTGPGEYGEGDVFLGVKVPETRAVAKNHKNLPLKDTIRLLRSMIHEERLLALLILVNKFENSGIGTRKDIYTAYLANTKFINNWDLVDLSAPKIVGAYLAGKNRKPLYALARSKDLWERRIAVLSTFNFIKIGEFEDIFEISRLLLKDEHDLIHKAVGWMLREAGKRDLRAEESFLKGSYRSMPRTMLRYSIERFPEKKRLAYLRGKI
jgi:3-methyladenine DNA glycosylase AlkD